MKRYAALIIDLKKSKSYMRIDRTDIQNYIKSTILTLNNLFRPSLKFDVMFSAGDEIQGLFSSPTAAYLYFRLFHMLISPVEIRAGIGIGEWDIKIDGNNSTEQDGPAYHNARHAIDNTEESLGYSILLYSNNESDIYINSAINSATALIDNQSEYQNELLLLTELMFPITAGKAIDIVRFGTVEELISQKNDMRYYSSWKSSKNIKKYPLSSLDSISFDFIAVDALDKEDSFYVSSGKIKGWPGKLSKLLGSSRQNTEKSLKSGNIYQARNSAIVALKLINQYIMGDN